MTAVVDTPAAPAPLAPAASAPRVEVELRPQWEQGFFWFFLVAPLAALAAGVGFAVAGHGITWLDAGLFVGWYVVAAHGITVGFHRLLTHRAFTAKPWLRAALAVAGSLAVQGGPIRWVADHRRHHAFSDQPGDPHSPWRFGTSPRAVARGLWWAHTGWLVNRERSSPERFAPDLVADPVLRRISALFPLWVAVSLLGPGAIAWAVTGDAAQAGLAVVWAGFVRMFLLHHVTWAINSICHVAGSRPFATRDHATNVPVLAVLSMGESWHNWHHAEPTSARHGVEPGQLDSSAALIRLFERLGWASDVRWPRPERVARKRLG